MTEPVKVAVKLLGVSTQLFEPPKLYTLLNLFFKEVLCSEVGWDRKWSAEEFIVVGC